MGGAIWCEPWNTPVPPKDLCKTPQLKTTHHTQEHQNSNTPNRSSSEKTKNFTALKLQKPKEHTSIPTTITFLIGTSTAHTWPPSLQFSWMPIFMQTDTNIHFFDRVLPTTTWNGTGCSTQQVFLMASYAHLYELTILFLEPWQNHGQSQIFRPSNIRAHRAANSGQCLTEILSNSIK